jgi:hypothetical protein
VTGTERAWALRPWAVRNTVPEGVPGVYILGEFDMHAGFTPVYVGRSDSDVRIRLLSHCTITTGRYFLVRPCACPTEAFQRECFYWHALRDSSCLLNSYHPDSPSGLCLTCPYCAAKLGGEVMGAGGRTGRDV